MGKIKLGLLDKPDLLTAMFTGRHTVETRSGEIVGIYDTRSAALSAVIEADEYSSASVTPPIPEPERANAIQGILNGIAKRKSENRFIPPGTLYLAEILAAEAQLC
jgi:hypothetical protein